MHSLSTFRARFPEFAGAPDGLVQSCLDDAEKLIDASVWGTNTNTGHGLAAAHYLAIAPGGMNARLEPDKTTTYGVAWNTLRDTVTCAIRVF